MFAAGSGHRERREQPRLSSRRRKLPHDQRRQNIEHFVRIWFAMLVRIDNAAIFELLAIRCGEMERLR